MKAFRDRENRLILTYWTMNTGEEFYTCDLSYLPLNSNNQVDDYGCTFVATGNLNFQEAGTSVIFDAKPGDAFNTRPQKSIKITALEDNCRWCYALSFDSLGTTNACTDPNSSYVSSGKRLTGESIKTPAGQEIEVSDPDKDIYIANPFLDTPANTLLYRNPDDQYFTNMETGKFYKIEKGNSIIIQSTIDGYIPKVYYQ